MIGVSKKGKCELKRYSATFFCVPISENNIRDSR